MDKSVAVVIVAAGSSRRMQGTIPKQWRLLGGIPLVAHSFRFFDTHPAVSQIVLALDAESLQRSDRLEFLASNCGKPVHYTAGGPHRQDTVWRALQALNPAPDLVLVHDAARPFPPAKGVQECIDVAHACGGAILARPVTETIKRVNADAVIVDTVDRQNLWAAQTPQGFRFASLLEAYQAQKQNLEAFTDDAGIFEANGGSVRVVTGSENNFKVTMPEDFERAELVLAGRNNT